MCAATRPQGQVSGWSTLGVLSRSEHTIGMLQEGFAVEILRGPLALRMTAGWVGVRTCDGPRKVVLEKGGGAPGPEFAFFFGDFFEVGDVRAGLRQDVMQVVANADEGKTFVQKFTDARCAEEEKSEDDIIFASCFDQTLRRGI